MIALVKYNAGNTSSLQAALQRLGVESQVTDSAIELRRADKVIFPGVGRAGSALQHLNDNALTEILPSLTQPFLGICLGMQLMCCLLHEDNCTGMQIFNCDVPRFPANLRVPHMGWNALESMRGELFKGVVPGSNLYFVHSYHVPCIAATSAECDYGGRFSAALQKNNFYGVQFHPEKSAHVGRRVLQNFLEL